VKPEEAFTYEDRDPFRRGEQRLGQPAGIYYLAGGFHVANYASRAASELRSRGAVLLATLTFSESQAERHVSGGAPRPPQSVVRPSTLAAHTEHPATN
jgi:hypothetical protein